MYSKKSKIPTKIIIDYVTCVELINSIGEEKFVNIMNNSIIITADEDSFYYINEVKNKVSDLKKKRRKNGL